MRMQLRIQERPARHPRTEANWIRIEDTVLVCEGCRSPMTLQNPVASSPPRLPPPFASALARACAHGCLLIIPLARLISKQEKFGSKVRVRNPIPDLDPRRSSVGHAGVIQSSRFGRFTTLRKYDPVAADWMRGSSNSIEILVELADKDSLIRRSSVHQAGNRPDKTDSRQKSNSETIMDVVEATSSSALSSSQHAIWGGAPLLSVEALAVLVVTAVILQLRFSSLVPRILLILSNSFSLLVHKANSPLESQKIVAEKIHEKAIQSSEEEGIKIPNLDYESARRETRSVYQDRIFRILGIVPVYIAPNSTTMGSAFYLRKWYHLENESSYAMQLQSPVISLTEGELNLPEGINQKSLPHREVLLDEQVENLKISEKYEMNSRSVEIFSKTWIPKSGEIKGAICFCHGYGDTCTFFFEGIARKLASQNFAVFAMDYPGFGLSGGLHGYIPSFDLLVDFVCEHYSSLKRQEEYRDIPFFLMGESMGGAVALKAHFSTPTAWDGAVLIAPMCKISEEMYPPWFMLEILKLLARIVPKARIVPSGDIAEIGFQDVQKRQQAMQNIIAYVGKPRLGTALSLLKATDDIEKLLDKVSLPMLILHGAKDRVTDPAVSKALYEQACSKDKKLKIYENAWHAVLEGESDETIDTAIGDIVAWLDAQSAKIRL